MRSEFFDLFSVRIRRQLPWDEVLDLQSEVGSQTLVGENDFSKTDNKDRIAYLERVEKELGYVYFGEKQWLRLRQSYPWLEYSLWVRNAMDTSLHDRFPAECFHRKRGIWSGCIDGEAIQKMWQAPADKFVKSDDEMAMFNVLDSSDCQELDNKWLIQVFHLFHNYPYYLDICFHELDKQEQIEKADFDVDSDIFIATNLVVNPFLLDEQLWGIRFHQGLLTVLFIGQNLAPSPLADLCGAEPTAGWLSSVQEKHPDFSIPHATSKHNRPFYL